MSNANSFIDDFGFLEEKREVDIESYPCGP
jgi:hypothetical protein